MSDVEERWGKALKEMEVSSFRAFLGRVTMGGALEAGTAKSFRYEAGVSRESHDAACGR